MKNLSLLLFALIIVSCSSDSTDPEPDNQPQNDPVEEQDSEDNEEEVMEEEEGIFPFSISVILKNYNGASGDGEYYSIDFLQNEAEPSSLFNISQAAGLSIELDLMDNGKEDILAFVNGPDKIVSSYNLSSGAFVSSDLATLSPNADSCFLYGVETGWTDNKYFTYVVDGCGDPDDVVLFAKDLSSGLVSTLPAVENAVVGDTPHGILVNEDFFFVHYGDLTPETVDTYQEGLKVYRTDTYEEVYSINTPARKDVYVDGNKLLITSQPDSVQIIDLETSEVLYSNSPAPQFSFINQVANTSIVGNRMGTVVLRPGNDKYPGYYDILSNEIVTISEDKYLEYFNLIPTEPPTEVLVPEEIKIDLETETFAVVYLIYDIGESIPRSSAIVFMEFDGEVLYEYEFPPVPFLPEKIVRRQ